MLSQPEGLVPCQKCPVLWEAKVVLVEDRSNWVQGAESTSEWIQIVLLEQLISMDDRLLFVPSSFSLLSWWLQVLGRT